MTRPVAFYAPLKSPNHPAPSGDRTMARLLMRAIGAAGFAPGLASELRSFDPTGAGHDELAARALREADKLAAIWLEAPEAERPCLWFTYHIYYKAPDWIGPRVAAGLDIPYVVAEGSRANKRALGPYATGHRAAEAALDAADAILAMTSHDRPALAAAKPPGQILADLPPFLDLSAWPPARADPQEGIRLLTVAMMREGAKCRSYRLLAQALRRLPARGWVLDIVGDGPARSGIEALFADFGPGQVRFHGAVTQTRDLASFYAGADLFVWPAVDEAYGMVLLESQAQGCPVVVGGYGGVPDVVRHGRTGLVCPPGDVETFAQSIAALIVDPARRSAMGAAARAFVRDERGLAVAAALLSAVFDAVLAKGRRSAA